MTLREILNEAVSVELISAGTGKEIARTGFENHYHYPEDYEIQMVRTVDGNYDVYFRAPDGAISNEPHKHKECYVGTLDKEKYSNNRWPYIQAWHDARVMCYKSSKVDKKFKEFIKKDINHKLNMDRYEKDKDGKTWYKEVE